VRPASLLPFVLATAPGLGQQDTTIRRPTRDTVVELPPLEVIGSILPAVGPAIAGDGRGGSVIGREVVSAWKPRLLPNLLAREPGFSLYDDLGSPAKTTLLTRGFAASPVVGLPQGISVFLDGIPVASVGSCRVTTTAWSCSTGGRRTA